MVPNLSTANPFYNFDFWASQIAPNEPEVIELTVFMPNGILLVVNISKTATLAELKEVRINSDVHLKFSLLEII